MRTQVLNIIERINTHAIDTFPNGTKTAIKNYEELSGKTFAIPDVDVFKKYFYESVGSRTNDRLFLSSYDSEMFADRNYVTLLDQIFGEVYKELREERHINIGIEYFNSLNIEGYVTCDSNNYFRGRREMPFFPTTKWYGRYYVIHIHSHREEYVVIDTPTFNGLLKVPADMVGRIIGKGGEKIRQISAELKRTVKVLDENK